MLPAYLFEKVAKSSKIDHSDLVRANDLIMQILTNYPFFAEHPKYIANAESYEDKVRLISAVTGQLFKQGYDFEIIKTAIKDMKDFDEELNEIFNILDSTIAQRKRSLNGTAFQFVTFGNFFINFRNAYEDKVIFEALLQRIDEVFTPEEILNVLNIYRAESQDEINLTYIALIMQRISESIRDSGAPLSIVAIEGVGFKLVNIQSEGKEI